MCSRRALGVLSMRRLQVEGSVDVAVGERQLARQQLQDALRSALLEATPVRSASERRRV